MYPSSLSRRLQNHPVNRSCILEFLQLPCGSLLTFCLVAGILINKTFLHWWVEGQLTHLVFPVAAALHPCLWAVGCDSCILLPGEARLCWEKSAVRELSECNVTSCRGGENCWKLSSRQNWLKMKPLPLVVPVVFFRETVWFWNVWTCQFGSKAEAFY